MPIWNILLMFQHTQHYTAIFSSYPVVVDTTKSETNLSLYRKKQRRFVSYIAEIPHAARNASEPDSPTAISIASAIQSFCCKNSAIRIFISLPDRAVKNAFNSSLPIHADIEQTNVIIQLLSHKQDQEKHHYNLIRNKSKQYIYKSKILNI